jgi:hypothetical protein
MEDDDVDDKGRFIMTNNIELFDWSCIQELISINLALVCQGNVRTTSPSRSEAPTPCERIPAKLLTAQICLLLRIKSMYLKKVI